MGAMASQITSLAIVYLAVYSGANPRKYQNSASLAFVQGIHRWPVNSPHKWPVTRKMLPFDDVIISTVPLCTIVLQVVLAPVVVREDPVPLVILVTLAPLETLEAVALQGRRAIGASADPQEVQVPLAAAQVLPEVPVFKVRRALQDLQEPAVSSLQWRHNGRDGVSNHQPHDCLFNRLLFPFDDVIMANTIEAWITKALFD